MQGAILRVKLRHLDKWNGARRAHAARYRQLLSGTGLVLPAEAPYANHVYHVFAVRTGERDAVARSLGEQGIQTNIHYPFPVHLQPAYVDPAYGRGSFPVTEAAADALLSLPLYPEMTADQVQAVARALDGR